MLAYPDDMDTDGDEDDEGDLLLNTGSHRANNSRLTARWTEGDRLTALKAYQQHGRDFEAVARLVGTKTEGQCRNYYHNYRRKHGVAASEGYALLKRAGKVPGVTYDEDLITDQIMQEEMEENELKQLDGQGNI
jgi:hypothetical protein